MTKRMIGSLFSLIAISALTIGCGSSSSTEKTKTNGRAIDDYIDGATVCIQNTCVQTKSEGIFTFIGKIPNSSLVVSGGKIHKTDIEFKGTLTAPAGSTVVSPLTTIIQSVVSSGQSISEAQKTVKKNLGLSHVSEDLTKYDPLAIISKGTDSDKQKAKQVFAKQTVVQTILATVSQTVSHVAANEKSKKDITQEVSNQIATLMVSSTSNFNIDNSANIKKIIENTAEKVLTKKEDKDKVKKVASIVGDKVKLTTQIISNSIKSGSSLGEIRIKAIAGIKAQTNMGTVIENAIIKDDISSLSTIDPVAAIATAEDNLNLDASSFNTITTIIEDTQPVITGAEGGNG